MASSSRPASAVAGGVERRLGPSRVGSVVVDIGGDVGALVVYTGPVSPGRELDIAPLDPRRPATHTGIRERRVAGGTRFAAVFPALAAGRYRLGAPDTGPSRVVTVRPGRVTEVHLDCREDVHV